MSRPSSKTSSRSLNDLIVADAGPLIGLGRIDALVLLSAVARHVIVPRAVERECIADPSKPGVATIQAAFVEGVLEWPPSEAIVDTPRLAGLGDGETAAIDLAERLVAPLLIDERRARAIAIERGIHVIGTLAVLVTARRRNHIDALQPVLQRLVDAGYFISERLLETALRSVGEWDDR